jgi:AraC-like DNA-binding protein
MADFDTTLYNIAVIDCCEHTLEALQRVGRARVISMSSRNAKQTITKNGSWQLIVIGATLMPLKSSFLTQLQELYPSVPSLVLRRVPGENKDELIRGDFMLSDRGNTHDFAIVSAIRELLPLPACKHNRQTAHSDLLKNVMELLTELYPDPDLDLESVASRLAISARRLSHILNREVGVSFPQLLRSMRIMESKRMLASAQYSVKQVAMRVGFTNSHYFSRSFKELTGFKASEFRSFKSQGESVPHLRRSVVAGTRQRNDKLTETGNTLRLVSPRR